MRLALRVVLALFLATAPVWAHHGSTGFDQKKPVKFLGKISLVDWINPHVVIHLDVAGADGKVATWLVKTRPPNAMTRRGFSRNAFAVGTELSVEGYQAIGGGNQVNGTLIVFTDGKKIETADCFTVGQPCFRPVDGTDKGFKTDSAAGTQVSAERLD